MSNNIKLISIVLFTLFSFFILLKGLDKSNIYSPEIKESNVDFNFKAKYLFSEEEVFINDLLNNDGMSLINIWASWCLPCRDEHAYLLNLNSFKEKIDSKSEIFEDFYFYVIKSQYKTTKNGKRYILLNVIKINIFLFLFVIKIDYKLFTSSR